MALLKSKTAATAAATAGRWARHSTRVRMASSANCTAQIAPLAATSGTCDRTDDDADACQQLPVQRRAQASHTSHRGVRRRAPHCTGSQPRLAQHRAAAAHAPVQRSLLTAGGRAAETAEAADAGGSSAPLTAPLRARCVGEALSRVAGVSAPRSAAAAPAPAPPGDPTMPTGEGGAAAGALDGGWPVNSWVAAPLSEVAWVAASKRALLRCASRAIVTSRGVSARASQLSGRLRRTRTTANSSRPTLHQTPRRARSKNSDAPAEATAAQTQPRRQVATCRRGAGAPLCTPAPCPGVAKVRSRGRGAYSSSSEIDATV